MATVIHLIMCVATHLDAVSRKGKIMQSDSLTGVDVTPPSPEPFVPRAFLLSCMYPHRPSAPHVSAGNPGHGELHLAVSTLADVMGS